MNKQLIDSSTSEESLWSLAIQESLTFFEYLVLLKHPNSSSRIALHVLQISPDYDFEDPEEQELDGLDEWVRRLSPVGYYEYGVLFDAAVNTPFQFNTEQVVELDRWLLGLAEESEIEEGVCSNPFADLVAYSIQNYILELTNQSPEGLRHLVDFVKSVVGQSVGCVNDHGEGNLAISLDWCDEFIQILMVKLSEFNEPTVEVKATLESLKKYEYENVRAAVAGDLKTPVTSLVILAQDENKRVRYAVAGNPNTPVETLETFAEDEFDDVCAAVAGNPKTPATTLVTLTQSKDKAVRYAVAGNPNTSVEILVTLAKDEGKWVRYAVAGNPNTPVEILVTLAQDQDDWVRKAVSSNPNTPVEILVTLAQDLDDWVRKAVSSNPNYLQGEQLSE
jgi:hypothetical protein